MRSGYTSMVSEMNSSIRSIKDEAMRRIVDIQNKVLDQTKQDFAVIGWDKFWRDRDLRANGQIERVVESVTDTELQFGEFDKRNGFGIVDGKAKCYVSGSGCSCPDFMMRGLPCKHMYFLAGILTRLIRDENLTIDDILND